MIKLIAFSASTRKGSLNQKLISQAVEVFKSKGQEVELISLADYDMPIYNGDIEALGIPENAIALTNKFKEADGFIISSPEYNSSFSPLLKNVIDWMSRTQSGQPSLIALSGKTVLLLAASPGPLGGLRGIYHFRQVLENIFMYVLPNVFALPVAHEAFTDEGLLKEEKYRKMLGDSVTKMIDFTKKLKG